MTTEDVRELVDGLYRLRTGALLQILAVIVSLIGLVYAISILGLSIFMSPQMGLGSIVSTIGSIVLVAFISGILMLIGFIYWFMATGNLRNYNPSKLGIGRTGVTIIVIGLIIALLAILALAGAVATLPPAGPREPALLFATTGGFAILVLLGLIMVFIGWILFSVMLIRLGDLENVSNTIHTAGILYLIGIIVSLVPYLTVIGEILILIAVILIYTGAGESLNRIR